VAFGCLDAVLLRLPCQLVLLVLLAVLLLLLLSVLPGSVLLLLHVGPLLVLLAVRRWGRQCSCLLLLLLLLLLCQKLLRLELVLLALLWHSSGRTCNFLCCRCRLVRRLLLLRLR
jgi:hypothetical protein